MINKPAAHTISALPDLGINPDKMGCVMLDVALGKPVADIIPRGWEYHSPHPDRGHISGVQREHHITLLYGLLESAQLWREHVDEVLAGWELGRLWLEELRVFDSPYADEDYVCVVAIPYSRERSPALEEAHRRLSLLPHIDTHPSRPHMTLAYVRRERRGDAVAALNRILPLPVTPLGINYGGQR